MKKLGRLRHLMIYICLLVLFIGLLAVNIVQIAKASEGDCIYSEYRDPIFKCWGPTTRLCQGPPDCPQPN